MIEEHKESIIQAVNTLYMDHNGGEEGAVPDSSIIFHLDGNFYLAVYNDKVKYVFDKSKNLYQNVIFELQVRKRLSLFGEYYFYIDSIKEDELNTFYTKKGYTNRNSHLYEHMPALPQFEPTGTIYELEEQPRIFENLDILSDYFLDREVSKEEMYSLMISPSFEMVMEDAVPMPAANTSELPKASRFIDLSKAE